MRKNKLPAVLILSLAMICLQCQPVKKITLADTYWRYTDDDLSYEFLLQPDGHIYSYHPNDDSPENDFWKQRGKRITFTMNDSYALYKGRLVNDSTMTGKGRSKGFQWTWSAKFVTGH